MIPSYFNLFQTHFPDELPITPVNPSTAVDWGLIKSIDPSLIDFENKDILQFIDDFPTYKLSSIDSSILSHPFAVRLFLIMQHCVSALSQKLRFYIKKAMKQQKEIKLINKKNKEYQRLYDADQKDEKKTKPEKCYACGKRFLLIKDLHAHISNEHPYLARPWKRIIQNKPDDKNEIIISNLRIDVSNLRQYIFDQEEKYKEIVQSLYSRNQALKRKNKELRFLQNPQVNATDLDSKYVSTLEVQPRYSPMINTYNQPYKPNPENFIYNSEGGCSDEEMYIAGESVRESIKNQADIVMNRKKKKDFRNIRDAIRIHLEHEIPMPVSINDASSNSSSLNLNLPQNISQNPSQIPPQNISQNISQIPPQNISQNISQIPPQNLTQNISQNPFEYHTENSTIEKQRDHSNEYESNGEEEVEVFHLNRTGKNQSMRSTYDPFMLSTTQNKTSARFVDDESMAKTSEKADPFYITDVSISSKKPGKSPTGKRLVESIDNSSSRRNRNNVMLITDDDNNYYSF